MNRIEERVCNCDTVESSNLSELKILSFSNTRNAECNMKTRTGTKNKTETNEEESIRMIGEDSSESETSDNDKEEAVAVNGGLKYSGLKEMAWDQNETEEDSTQEGEKSKHGLE